MDTGIGTTLVLLNCYGSFFSWLAPKNNLDQSALQWWYQRQCDRQHHNAELIRDGVLQTLFALRRSLELTHAQQQSVSSDQLGQLESLYGELETISNNLSPAFSRDHVTLAMQHILNQWQSTHPTVTLSSHLTVDHDVDHHIGLMLLEDCLAAMDGRLSETAAVDITFAKHDQPHQHRNDQPEVSEEHSLTAMLTLHIQDAHDYHRRAIATRLVYVCRSFTLLTGGTSVHTQGDKWLQWQFCWPLHLTPSPSPKCP